MAWHRALGGSGDFLSPAPRGQGEIREQSQACPNHPLVILKCVLPPVFLAALNRNRDSILGKGAAPTVPSHTAGQPQPGRLMERFSQEPPFQISVKAIISLLGIRGPQRGEVSPTPPSHFSQCVKMCELPFNSGQVMFLTC